MATTRKKKSGEGEGALAAAARQALERRAAKLLERLPGGEVTWKFHNASFSVGGKVFGFTRGTQVVCKLPRVRVEEIVAEGMGEALVMGKRTMKEWVVVEPTDDAEELVLLREAMEFVREK